VLNATHSKVQVGKHSSNTFPIQNGLRRCFIDIAFQLAAKKMLSGMSTNTSRDFNRMGTFSFWSTLNMLIYWAKLKKFLFVSSKEVGLDMLRKLNASSSEYGTKSQKDGYQINEKLRTKILYGKLVNKQLA